MSAAPTLWQTPFGELQLHCYPQRGSDPRQAWASADRLLLDACSELDVDQLGALVVNDSHGALCCALRSAQLWTDSALSVLALRANEARNGLSTTSVVPSTQTPTVGGSVVMRVPKNLAYFEHQLATLAQVMPKGSMLLAAGMDKHLSPRTAELLERFIGPTERHRGRLKARLFSVRRSADPAPKPAACAAYRCDAAGGELRALPNVFSRERLDGGAALLLSALTRLQPVDHVVDLACGNGVLGLAAFRTGLAGHVTFADESAMAIASARNNAMRLAGDLAGQWQYLQGDGLLDYRGEPAGLILCNPPFHLDTHVDEFAGRRLLRQCADHLAPEGQLCLVANRHLRYRPLLQRIFGRCEQLAQDKRFRVLLCADPAP